MRSLPRALLVLAPVLLLACATPTRPRVPAPPPGARVPSGDRCVRTWRRLELCRVTPAALGTLVDQRLSFLGFCGQASAPVRWALERCAAGRTCRERSQCLGAHLPEVVAAHFEAELPCSRLNGIINEGSDRLKERAAALPVEPDAYRDVARLITALAIRMRAFAPHDPQTQPDAVAYADLLVRFSAVFDTLAEALETGDVAAAGVVKRRMAACARDEQVLIDRLNRRCRGAPAPDPRP